MSIWFEKEKRQEMGSSVFSMINSDVLTRHRYYIKSIAEVIQFLTINELALRGTYDIEEHQEKSLFRNLFEYTVQKDEKLADCIKNIPSNATYLSPDIQNDIIQIMADIVTENIVEDIKNADVPWFTILEDGTRDKNNRENIAIGVRYVINGKAKESILAIKTCTSLDAKTFTDLTLKVLDSCDLDTSKILSQCYDGAAVMSGEKGGVQTLLQKRLNRKIPYVHCCNHRLHLVIIKSINEVTEVKQFFEQCSMLYNFLKRGSISSFYEGHALCRLLEQRWSGHINVTRIIFNNYKKIIEALEKVVINTDNGEYIAEATGLLTIVKSKEFRFCLILMKKVLEQLQPADKLLQSREFSLRDSIVILNSTIDSLSNFRNNTVYESIVNEMNTEFDIGEENVSTLKRRRKSNERFRSFIITDSIGERTEEIDLTDSQHFKVIFYQTMDIILNEMKKRFIDNNELLDAISSAENEEMDLQKMKYLQTLNIKLPSQEEISVVKRFIQNQRNKNPNITIFDELFHQRVTFEDTYNLLATTKTFGCSTAICESTFSVLTRINRSPRLSMYHQRMANLILLAFEKDRTKCIDMDILLKKFNSLKKRRLQLF